MLSLLAHARHHAALKTPFDTLGVTARIRVYWPLDEKWYSGTVVRFDSARARHQVLYDDEDTRWYDLSTRRWNLLHEFDQ